MANAIELAVVYQTMLDEQLEAEALTSWMEGNAGMVNFVGVSQVKIPSITTSGFGDMSRDGDYPVGSVVLANQTVDITYDRAVALKADIFDVEESQGVANGGNIVKVFNKTQAVPEIDQTRHAKLFSYANAAVKTAAYTPVVGTIYSQLISDIEEIQGTIGENYELVIHIRSKVASILAKSTEMTKYVALTDGEMSFTAGSGQVITSKIKLLDGIPLLRMPNNRMYSNVTLNVGTVGDPTFGYSTNDYSANINWIIMAREVPVAVKKYQNTKIVPQSINSTSRQDCIIPNLYHDLFVFDNKVNGLYVSYTAIAAIELAGTLAKGTGTGNTKYTATGVATGNTLGYQVNDAALTGATLPNYNDILTTTTDFTVYTSGADIEAAATKYLIVYELDSNLRVVSLFQKILTGVVSTG